MPTATYTVEWAGTAGAAGGSWVDETSRVKSMTWRRGRDDWLSDVQPADATLVLKNADSRYSLGHADAAAHVDLMRAVRIRASLGVSAYDDLMAGIAWLSNWRLADSSGPIADQGTENLSGTENGNPTYGNSGPSNAMTSTVAFDGVGDYFDCGGASSALDFERTDAFSVSAWVYVASLADHRSFLSKRTAATATGWNILISSGGKLRVRLSHAASGTSTDVQGGTTLAVNTWYHVLVVKAAGSGAASEFSLYVNGEAESVTVNSDTLGTNNISNAGTVKIGRRGDAGMQFAGRLAQIGVVGSALTAAQARLLYEGGITHNLFLGYVTSITPFPSLDEQAAEVRLVDGFGWLALPKTTPTYSSPAAQATGVRIGEALDAQDINGNQVWPTAMRALDTGQTSYQPSHADTTTLSQLQDIATNEAGLVYMRGDGYVVFEDRHHRLKNGDGGAADHLTSQATIHRSTDPTMTDLEAEQPVRDIVNEVKVTYTGDATVTRGNSTSQQAYGSRRLDISATGLTASEATDRADWTVSRRKDPHTRPIVGLMNGSANRLVHILARDISDRITIRDPAGAGYPAETGVDEDFFIESVEHEVWDTGRFHRCRWQCSQVDPQSYWVLGTSALGTSTRLAY